MIQNLPTLITFTFGLTILITLFLFIRAIKYSKTESSRKKAKPIQLGLTIWLLIQSLLTVTNTYNTNTNTFPPKILIFGILPAIISIVLLFITSKGRQFIDSLPLLHLTYLHTIRIPVEIVLLWLYLNKAIPELMTFEGRNWDIVAGISAPFIAYFGITKLKIKRPIILIWNIICLGLLLNIVINAFFSTPSPVQKWAFDQPNIAILNFPFSGLPTFIVPIVLLGHLVSIRQILQKKTIIK